MKARSVEAAGGGNRLGRCNNAALRKATRRLGKLYDAALDTSGLKATQYILLTQIHELGSPTMANLANSLLMDLSATRHSLEPLIRERLVRLHVDSRDRRVKRVMLTPSGTTKFKKMSELWEKAQDRFERALGRARAAKLRSELAFLTSDEFSEALAATS
jgi:DNA-binding MarR family transcriptional regulator